MAGPLLNINNPAIALLSCAIFALALSIYVSSSSSTPQPAYNVHTCVDPSAPASLQSLQHSRPSPALASASSPASSFPSSSLLLPREDAFLQGPTIPGYNFRTNSCVGSPSRPNRPDRPLVLDLPAMYAVQPYMNHKADLPTCWTKERYRQWKAGHLPTFPVPPRTEALLSHLMFSIVTGKVNHRSRADVIMCTYAQQLRYGLFWFHSDGEDDEERLPLIGNVEGTDGHCDHSCSERKWVTGMNVTFRLGLQDPNVHWWMIGDDDTFIAPKHLAAITAQYHHSRPYLIGSVHYKLDGVDDVHGLFGGAGFLISRQLVLNILPHFHRCFGYTHSESDLFLSRCMVDFGHAILVDRMEMGSQPPRYYIEQEDDCVEQIRPGLSKGATYHYVRPWQDYYYLYMLYLAFSD